MTTDYAYTIADIQSRLTARFPGYTFTVTVNGEDVDITANPPLTDEPWREAMEMWGMGPPEY
jgi:hypothetical protein